MRGVIRCVRLPVRVNQNALKQPAVGYGYRITTEPVHKGEEYRRSGYDQILAAFFKTGYGGALIAHHRRQTMKDGIYGCAG